MLPERIAPYGVKTWLAHYVVSSVQKQTWLSPPHSRVEEKDTCHWRRPALITPNKCSSLCCKRLRNS